MTERFHQPERNFPRDNQADASHIRRMSKTAKAVAVQAPTVVPPYGLILGAAVLAGGLADLIDKLIR